MSNTVVGIGAFAVGLLVGVLIVLFMFLHDTACAAKRKSGDDAND